MPHQCVHCGKIYEKATKALIDGCDECHGHFFFYIKEEQLNKIREKPAEVMEMPKEEKKKIEEDIRDMAGVLEEDTPIILDIESVRATGTGKFEIDVVNLFQKNRPLIYKLEEGKYIIDLASTLSGSQKEIKQIKDPDKK